MGSVLALPLLALAGALLVVAQPAAAAPTALVPGPAPTGSTIIVAPAGGSPVAAIDLWFRAPSVGFGAKPALSLSRVAAQTVAASAPLVGEPLGDIISAVGGKLVINTFGDSVGISALVPADAARDVIKAMTIAYFSPVVTQDGFTAASRDVATQALIASFDPSIVVRDTAFAQLFASGPQHFPPLGDAKDVATLTIDKVRAFADRAFRAQNAVLVVSGTVDPTVATAASKGRPAAASSDEAEAPASSALAAAPQPVTQPFDETVGAYAWAGPPIASEDEATTMDFIADYLFRAESGVLARSVPASFPNAFVAGQFITLHDPGVMFVSFGGADLDALRGAVDKGIAAMQTPLPKATFEAARSAFEYHLLSDLQTPSSLADSLGWYSIEGSPKYAPGAEGSGGTYFSIAAAMTPQSVARIAAKYLGKPGASVSLVARPSKSTPEKGQS